MAHAEGDAARVNPQLVRPQAVAVAEGVRDSPLVPFFQPLTQLLPAMLPGQVSAERITSTGDIAKRWQFNLAAPPVL